MPTIIDRQLISQLDKSNVLGSIFSLPSQITQAWNEASAISMPSYADKISNIVFVGMGGSSLGAQVVKSLYASRLQLPFEIINNYHLPAYVNQHTLVILSSYSGTTEEVLSCSQEAMAYQAQIIVISAGGDLIQLAKQHQFPYYQIDPHHNPSNQPRMAIGYAIAGTLGLLHSAGLVQIDTTDITSTVTLLQDASPAHQPEQSDDPTKELAQLAQQKMLMLISADHLTGATHVFNNQLNENAKHLTWEHEIPELNHHYLEALSHPKQFSSQLLFIFCQSNLYSPQISQRLEITRQLVEAQKYQTHTITVSGSNPLQQAFWLIQFGAYTNFYLAMLHGIDPAPIPNVDFFKSELKKSS